MKILQQNQILIAKILLITILKNIKKDETLFEPISRTKIFSC